MRNLASLFLPESTSVDIIKAVEKILITLYDRTDVKSMDDFRYQVLYTKAARGATFLQVYSFPPTSTTAKYHSL